MILVTGASGFIGRYLIKELVKEGFKVVATSRSLKGTDFESPQILVLPLDITKKEDFLKLPDGIEAVFHLAAHIPCYEDEINHAEELLRVNAIGTYNLLEFCYLQSVKKIICSSSISVYGTDVSPPIAEDDCTYPASLYGSSKLLGELFCEKYRKETPLECISLRYSAVYGFGIRPYYVLPIFVEKVLKNENIEIYGSGESMMDYVYVKDVVSANLLAYKLQSKSVQKSVYNIGSGIGTNVIELAQKIKQTFPNSKSKIVINKKKKAKKSKIWLDISKAKEELDYIVEYPLEKGLQDYKAIMLRNRD